SIELLVRGSGVEEPGIEVQRQQGISIVLPGLVIGAGEVAARLPLRRDRAESHGDGALGRIRDRRAWIFEVGRRKTMERAGALANAASHGVAPVDDAGIVGIGATEAALPGDRHARERLRS